MSITHSEVSMRPVMSLLTVPGSKIKFSNPTFGLSDHQELCKKHLLEGETYTVEAIEVGGWISSVLIKEVPGVRFNTVNFTNV